VVIAQAVAEPSRALRWMLPWVEIGGLLVIPGGDREPAVEAHPGVRPDRVLHYRVPCGGPQRTLWLGRRIL
jgi:hypothetical protein